MEYMRCKKTGWVYPASPQLRERTDMELFAIKGALTVDTIPNLSEFLHADAEAAKPAKKVDAVADAFEAKVAGTDARTRGRPLSEPKA